ncbi:MAG: SDR family NAD(P)-dependent oxidoreductase [Bacteroidetes bacterium]|nr:SDR family NAD(P)-dependent oxidoreductase [Bacteroidota bacterium]
MKTAVITGGNSGIGKATAIALAKKQYRVIIHGRDAEKTIQAVEEIKLKSGSSNVEGISTDISVIAGMRKLSDAIKEKTNSIDALVLSTGVILPNQVFTADGLEAGFAIQYLSRFAVTQMLMPELISGKARIVMVGAPVIKGAKIFFDDISLKNNFTMIRAMAQEMFANHLFVQEFAKRNPDNNVVMNIANVGVANTGIVRNSNLFFKIGLKLFGTSPEKAATNFVYLASDDEVSYSGYFLKKPGHPTIKEKNNFDSVVSEKLWTKSMELISSHL